MKIRYLLPSCVVIFVAIGSGCSGGSEGDTSPPPARDAQAGANQAVQGIQSSNMSPEQKKAAEDYMRRGAEGAQKMKSNAPVGVPGQK